MNYSDLFTRQNVAVTTVLLLILGVLWFKPVIFQHRFEIGWPYVAIVRGQEKVEAIRRGTRTYYGDVEFNGTHVFYKYLASDVTTAAIVLLLGIVVSRQLTGGSSNEA